MSVKQVVVIEVDVVDVESASEAREAAFELVRPLLVPSKKRGPKGSGPRAVVTGCRVEEPNHGWSVTTDGKVMPVGETLLTEKSAE